IADFEIQIDTEGNLRRLQRVEYRIDRDPKIKNLKLFNLRYNVSLAKDALDDFATFTLDKNETEWIRRASGGSGFELNRKRTQDFVLQMGDEHPQTVTLSLTFAGYTNRWVAIVDGRRATRLVLTVQRG